eukprot:1776349-Pleurochrysis_carterae.AAC.1
MTFPPCVFWLRAAPTQSRLPELRKTSVSPSRTADPVTVMSVRTPRDTILGVMAMSGGSGGGAGGGSSGGGGGTDGDGADGGGRWGGGDGGKLGGDGKGLGSRGGAGKNGGCGGGDGGGGPGHTVSRPRMQSVPFRSQSASMLSSANTTCV